LNLVMKPGAEEDHCQARVEVKEAAKVVIRAVMMMIWPAVQMIAEVLVMLLKLI